MASDFISVPIRGYSKTDPSWWNALRAAGVLLEAQVASLVGIPITSFNLANNQVAAADVTGLLFDAIVAMVGGFVCEYRIYRQTTGGGATELAEQGTLIGAYSSVAATWNMTNGPVVGNAGITFSITNAGQVQYQSTNITGTANISKIVFSARNFTV